MAPTQLLLGTNTAGAGAQTAAAFKVIEKLELSIELPGKGDGEESLKGSILTSLGFHHYLDYQVFSLLPFLTLTAMLTLTATMLTLT